MPINSKSCFVLALTILVLTSCAAASTNGDVLSISVSGLDIRLMSTERLQAEKVVGKPSKQEYFKNGQEDFAWTDFFVYSYLDDRLRLHVDAKTEKIIRISVRLDSDLDVKLPMGISKNSSLSQAKDGFKKFGIAESYSNGRFLMGRYQPTSEKPAVIFSIWFNDAGRPTWYDIYYEKSW